MAQQIAAAGRRRRDLSRRRGDDVGDLFERAVEAVENAVELHPHRVRQVVAGHIVGWARWTAGIGNVVRMILRLEHVHDMRAERLRGLDHVRSRRIRLPCHRERRGRTVNDDAGLDQDVHELGRGEEVRLIGGQDEAARIAHLRIVEHVGVDRDRRPPAPRTPRAAAATPRADVLGAARRPALSGLDGLARRGDPLRMNGPVVAAPFVDGVLRHLVHVEEKVLVPF